MIGLESKTDTRCGEVAVKGEKGLRPWTRLADSRPSAA